MATEIARPLVPQPAADVQICECASALDRTLRFRAHSLCIARLLHRIASVRCDPWRSIEYAWQVTTRTTPFYSRSIWKRTVVVNITVFVAAMGQGDLL